MIRHRDLREKNYNKINKQLNFVSLSLQNEKYILKKYIASTRAWIQDFSLGVGNGLSLVPNYVDIPSYVYICYITYTHTYNAYQIPILYDQYTNHILTKSSFCL